MPEQEGGPVEPGAERSDWTYLLDVDGEELRLAEGETVIGRSRSCDVTIADPSASRRHVLVTAEAGQVRATDLGSSNGTLINGERLAGDRDLFTGDRIVIGETELKLTVVPPEREEAAPAPPPPAPPEELGAATIRIETGTAPCPGCGAAVPLQAESCPRCGTAMAEESPAGAEAARPAPPPAPTTPPPPPASPPPPSPPPAAASAGEPSESTPVEGIPTGLAGMEPPSKTMRMGPETTAKPPEPPAGGRTEIFRTGPETDAPSPFAADRTVLERVDRGGGEVLPAIDQTARAEAPSPPPPPRPAPASPPPPPALAAATPVAAPAPAPPDPAAAAGAAAALQGAGFFRRLGAVLIDAVWIWAVCFVLTLPFGGPTGRWGSVVLMLFSMLLGIGVPVVGWARWGTTPGKALLKLYVTLDDGHVFGIGFGKALVRFLSYVVSGALFFVGFLMVLVTKENRALHDYVAGTWVLRR